MVKACVIADAMLTAVARGGAVEEWDPIKVCSFSLSPREVDAHHVLGVVEWRAFADLTMHFSRTHEEMWMHSACDKRPSLPPTLVVEKAALLPT